MIRAGTRRVLVLVAVLAGAALAIAVVLELASDDGAARSAALGFYLVGAIAGFLGFILGSRGFFRPRHADRKSQQTAEEARESRVLASLLMILGVVFVLIGAVLDPRATVV